MYKLFFKRLVDIIVSLIGLIVLLPIFLLITVLLRLKTGDTAFFTQVRPGLNEKLFRLIKFKTMSDTVDQNGKLLPDAQRITRIGKFIRSTSLDEIPQLINVLKGDMSLIGPRPLLVKYLDRYSEEQKKRHDVKPGITGWAQVNGRNAISWEKKLNYDIYYVKNLSISLDFKILFLTLVKVVKRENINSQSAVTMEEFIGSKK